MQVHLDNPDAEEENLMQPRTELLEKERSQWGEKDNPIPDENRSRLGTRSDLGTDGSGMESKKPRDKDTAAHVLYTHEHILDKGK